MNNLTVSHYYFYSTFPPKCSQCNIILYFTKVIIISNTFDRHEIVSIWGLPKPFLCSVWLGGTKSRALLLQTDVHLCVLSSQWLSVSSFVWASHALHWKVTSCTHNFTRMLNLTLPVQIKWSRSHFDCWRNLLSAGRAYQNDGERHPSLKMFNSASIALKMISVHIWTCVRARTCVWVYVISKCKRKGLQTGLCKGEAFLNCLNKLL